MTLTFHFQLLQMDAQFLKFRSDFACLEKMQKVYTFLALGLWRMFAILIFSLFASIFLWYQVKRPIASFCCKEGNSVMFIGKKRFRQSGGPKEEVCGSWPDTLWVLTSGWWWLTLSISWEKRYNWHAVLALKGALLLVTQSFLHKYSACYESEETPGEIMNSGCSC